MILVGAAFVFVAFVFNFGMFVRELDYGIASLEASLAHEELQLLPQEQADAPLVAHEIRIKAAGIRAPIVYIDEIETHVFTEALRRGVVHYPDTALPGQAGNVYIFGHSSDWAGVESPYRHVFALLPHLVAGDEIEISDAAGRVFVYVVTETFIVSPTDMRVLDQGDGTQFLLTLQTSYPFGTTLARYIVRASLRTP